MLSCWMVPLTVRLFTLVIGEPSALTFPRMATYGTFWSGYVFMISFRFESNSNTAAFCNRWNHNSNIIWYTQRSGCNKAMVIQLSFQKIMSVAWIMHYAWHPKFQNHCHFLIVFPEKSTKSELFITFCNMPVLCSDLSLDQCPTFKVLGPIV